MKKFLFLVTAALVALSSSAAPVDPAAAHRIAKNYLTEQYDGKLMAPAALNPVLIKTEMSEGKVEKPVYYIYNTSTTFLVVAGDDRAEEILMVGDAPLEDINNLPLGMLDMLGIYKQEITYLLENPKLQVKKFSEIHAATTPKLKATTIGPLLTAMWDQTAPYYNLCKFTYNGRTYQCYTGCPATSASMVLYFWKYPDGVDALPSYTANLDLSSNQSVSYTYPALEATTFDWANMKDSYSSYTTAQGNAVATLMRYVGQAENMMYGTASAGGSGIWSNENYRIANMFKTFGYKSTARNAQKSNYSETSWASLIQGELAAGRPLVYCAVSTSAGGHAFNVDGYRDSDGKYHVNWGWSGSGNSWFAMNAFSNSYGTFSQQQQAIVGIEPPDGTFTQLTVTPETLTFEATSGTTVTKTFTVKGENLKGDVTISKTGSTVYTISPTTISKEDATAGATVTVTYKPTSAGTHTATIAVASTNAATQTIAVTGTATAAVPTLTADPTSLSFETEAGTPVTKTFYLKGYNLTSSSPVTLSVSGTGFSVDKATVTKTAVTNGITITVTYNPSAAGNHTGTITISHTGAQSATVELNGTATGPVRTITANPTALNFTALVGETKTATFTVTGSNLTGPLALSVNNSNYRVSPTTISVADAAAGKTVTVTYAPTTFGTTSAVVTISGGDAPAATVTLNGQADIVKYAPVMLPAVESGIKINSFRADWTDETPDANVDSYTLEVSPKVVEPVYELIGSIDGTSYTNQGYQAVSLSAPWSGNNVYSGNGAIYFRNATHASATTDGYIRYTIPAGYQNKTFTVRIVTASGQYGSGRFVVSSNQTSAVTYNMSEGEVHNWLVTGSTGNVITITSPEDQYSPDIALIEIYSGNATEAKLKANETGDATYRLITGITDKFYTVNDLTAEGTFLYRVKALYIDGTESAWSNVEEVTLF